MPKRQANEASGRTAGAGGGAPRLGGLLRRGGCCAAVLVISGAAGGCLEFRRGESKTVDKVVDTKPEVVRDASLDDGSIDLRGTVLTVAVTPGCNLVETETVEHDTKYEREFDDEDTVLPLAMLEVMSLAPMIAGVALLADSPNVYDDDPNGRLYNPTGKTAVVNAGAALVAVGAVVNIWPTVELIRSAVPESDTSTSTRNGQVLQRDVDCNADASAGGRYVSLRWQGGTYSLGSTDSSGRLSSDLKQVLPLSLFQSTTPPVSMGVWLDSQYMGDVGVASVGAALFAERDEQDDLAWRGSDPEACRANRNEQACAGVRRYLGTYPTGRHAAEANALVAALQPVTPPVTGPVIATDPTSERTQHAIDESQASAQHAMESVWKRFEEETKRNEERTDKEARQAGHKACTDSCRKECTDDKSCRTTCEEQCP